MSVSDSTTSEEAGEEPLDLRLVPLALAAWAGSWWGTDARMVPALVLAGILLVAGAVLVRSRRREQAAAMLLVALICAGMGWARAAQLEHSTAGTLAAERAVVRAEVVLTSDPRFSARSGVMPELTQVPARLVLLEGRGATVRQRVPVQLRATGELADELVRIPAGTTIAIQARLAVPDPGEPVAALVSLRSPPQTVRPPSTAGRMVNQLRAGLRGSMRHNPPAQAGLLPSLVAGDTSGLDPGIEQDFRTTGLTHLTAVSGTNLTLTLVFVLGAARWCGLRGWWVRGLGVGAVVAFVVVCRAEPSVLRAGAMGLVALAGVGLAGGRGKGMRHLCVAVWLLVMADPWLGRSVGFALSTLATGGILWWGRQWSEQVRWAPAWVGESLAVPLAAQLVTQPVVTWLSGEVSLVGLVANALAGPFVGPATVLGLVSMLVAPLWGGGAAVVGWAAGWCVQPIIWVATALSALPAATWRWPATPVLLAVLGMLCVAGSVLVGPALASARLCALAAAVMVAASLWHPPPAGWPGPWRVAFCEVGQGDATVLWAAPGQAVLVDAGPPGPQTVGCLHQLGVRSLPLLVLTHYHDDHIGALDNVLDDFAVGQALLNPFASPAPAAERVRGVLAAHGVVLHTALVGQQLRVGAVEWTTAGVGAQAVLGAAGEGESSQDNDSSIVAVARADGLRVVLGGDVEPAGQQRVVAAGWQPSADVLKMPHHGSSRQDERFWCQSGAVLAVASAGFRNSYGHPAPAALRLAERCGMASMRTDLGGSITLWRADGQLQVRRQRDGPP